MALFGFIVDEIFTLANFLEESGEDLGSNLDLLNQKGQPIILLTIAKFTCSHLPSPIHE